MLWDVRPKTDSTGEVLEMPITKFIWTVGKPVRPDHVYRLTATYDNPTGQTIPEGGMGVIGGIIALTGGARWPAVDRRHPDYVADLSAILAGEGGMAHHSVP